MTSQAKVHHRTEKEEAGDQPVLQRCPWCIALPRSSVFRTDTRADWLAIFAAIRRSIEMFTDGGLNREVF